MRIFSGIQPTGDKHLGNLIGGFRQYAATQERGEGFFCIVDLHSISVDYDPEDFREKTLDLAAMLFATGLDPERSTVFAQSHVSAHAEAGWLLGSVTSFGQLNRMTQFKDKGRGDERAGAGLFFYPVLMASDILLYDTDSVPVGDDQRQHIELTRDVATRFNATFGETFVIPAADIEAEGARIMALDDPTKKMSKSGAPGSYIAFQDTPDEIRRKINRAVTDSGSEVVASPDKPALTNLLCIYSIFSDTPVAELEARYQGVGYGGFKKDLGDVIVSVRMRSPPPCFPRWFCIWRESSLVKASHVLGRPRLRTVWERSGS